MKAFHFISSRHGLNTIKEQQVKASQLDDLNDPFELYSVNMSDRKYRKEFLELKKYMAKKIGILCFSKRWRSPLMWSHYADRHKGMALIFDIKDDVVKEVKYRKNRVNIDVEKDLLNKGINNSVADKILATKYSQWSYEEELRVFLENDKCKKVGDHLFHELGDELHLKGVVLGALSETKPTDIAKVLPKGLSIEVTKSRLAYNTYTIVRNKSVKPILVEGLA